jgi:Ser/Thr protein kinase RdoA (MazF antagonist)
VSEIQDNLQFEKLCNHLMLGEIVGVPEALSGGFMHRMYAFETSTGKYAVKALNPEIMRRLVAMQNFITSERIAHFASKHIPALPAKKLNGTVMKEVDGQFYLIFDWIEGRCLKPNEINTVHCEKIGAILSDIHKTDFSDLGIRNNFSEDGQLTDWNYYLQKGQQKNTEWVNLLLENIDKLKDWNALAKTSAKQLASNMVISHGDLDPKNVMWHQTIPSLLIGNQQAIEILCKT